jgi:hypothetical protein
MQIEIILDSKKLEAAIGRMRGPEVYRIVRGALTRAAYAARARAVRRFASQGIGKSIFGRKDSGAYKLITVSEFRQQGDTLIGALRAVGLAAMQETGGQTKPYVIVPKKVTTLRYVVAGALQFSGVVERPSGTPIVARPFMRQAIGQLQDDAIADIRRDLAGLWERAA